MKANEKLSIILEVLDADPEGITTATALDSIEEWDSMGVISVIAMLDRSFDVRLTAEDVAELKTIGDIMLLMNPK